VAELVLFEFCGEPLAFTREQLEDARIRAQEIMPAVDWLAAAPAQQFVDAVSLAAVVGLPQSWLEEQARRGRLPSLQLGKYRRFELSEAIAALRKLGKAS
jgi:hypothetical protein